MTSPNDRYFVLEFEPLVVYHRPPPKLVNHKDLDRDEIEFQRGEPIAVPVPIARFLADPKQELKDYLFNFPGWQLCSGKLRDALARAEVTNVQYFPAEIITKAGKSVSSDYSIANFLGRVKCLDWDKSSYDDTHRADGLVVHIDKLVLDPTHLQGRKLVRMEENSSVLLVSHGVRRHLEAAGVTGVRFTEAEKFQV